MNDVQFLLDTADSCIMGFLPIQELVDKGFGVDIRLTDSHYADQLGRYGVAILRTEKGRLTFYGSMYNDELHKALAEACREAAHKASLRKNR